MVNCLHNVSQNLEIDQILYQTGELNSVGGGFVLLQRLTSINVKLLNSN